MANAGLSNGVIPYGNFSVYRPGGVVSVLKCSEATTVQVIMIHL